MIKNINGNIFDSTENLIVHQTNCIGVMGGGIALQIKRLYRNVFIEYLTLCNSYKEKSNLLGKIQVIAVSETRSIVNLFGQLDIGGVQDTDYVAFENGLKLLSEYMIKNKISSVAFPYKIGCGLGGGNWNFILKLIEKYMSEFDCVIYRIE